MALNEKQHRNKTKLINFWATEDEKAEIKALAKALDLDVSKTIRYGLQLAREEHERQKAASWNVPVRR